MRARGRSGRAPAALGALLAGAGLTGCPAEPVARHDVPYYAAHPDARAAVVAACERDPGNRAKDPDCINALAAERQAGVGRLRDLPPLGLSPPDR